MDDTSGFVNGQTYHRNPYWSSDRARFPEAVADDPKYLLGTNAPTENNGIYTWQEDWSDRLTHTSMAGLVTLARSTYTLDSQSKRLVIEDEVEVDPSLYVAWCFSPSELPAFVGDGFRFSDGTDSLSVVVEVLDGTTKLHAVGSDPVDWYSGLNRIAKFVQYVPQDGNRHYHVRVTIQ